MEPIKNYITYKLLIRKRKTMKVFFTLLSSFIGLSAFAQITLDSSSIATLGTTAVFGQDFNPNNLSITSGSASAQNWDYSTLSFNAFDSIKYQAPAALGTPVPFPQANVAYQQDGIDVYLQKTDSTLSFVGIYGDIVGAGTPLAIRYTPHQKIMNFPSTYGSSAMSISVFDSVSPDIFTGTFDSLRIRRTTISEVEFDAFGALVTPAGTYPNTLRQYTHEKTYDSVYAFNALIGWFLFINDSSSTHIYDWHTTTEGHPVLSVEADAKNGNFISADFLVGNTLLAASNVTPVTCYNGSDGIISITAVGGSQNYSYQWSNGNSGSMATNLSEGFYSVTVYDGSDSVVLNPYVAQPAEMFIDTVLVQDEVNGNDGSIEVDVQGGTAPYTFSWSSGGSANPLTGLTAGTYTLTVNDANMCSATATFVVGDATSVNEKLTSNEFSIYPNPANASIHFQTQQAANLKLNIMALNGSVVKQFVHNGTHTQLDVSALPKGVYILIGEGEHTVLNKRIIIAR